MLHTSTLRAASRNGFIKRVVALLLLLILLPVAASAYTLVLRDGRSLDVPEGFKVTRAGVTYEYAAGLYVTIQMTSIDVEATERANREPAGAFLRRIDGRTGLQAENTASALDGTSRQTRRTLTDKELEAVRARRLASESLYERRRKELGLPSAEETRRQREDEARRLSEMERETEASEASQEAYWRARAESLRTAMAANDAEINYLRLELRDASDYFPTVSFTSLTPFPFVSTGIAGFSGPRYPSRVWRDPRRGYGPRPIPSGGIGFGRGRARGHILFNGRGPYPGFTRRPGFGTRGVTVLPVPTYLPYSADYDRSALMTRLRELEAERAGLLARWRLLEDEARRAGAPPGWLRP